MNIKTLLANCGEVRIVKLGDVCEILRGKRLTKRDLVDGGDYPVFHGGKEPIGYYHGKNRDANTTMIINTGDCGCVSWSDKDFWSSDGCFCVKTPQDILNKFIYYVLSNKEYEIKSKTRTAGIPTLDKKDVENIIIPLPPLSTQLKVVEILDKFTALQTELQKELKLRKKQYEYYRDKLLTFSEEERERWGVALMDVSELESIGVDKKIIEGEKMITLLNYMDVYKNHYLDKDTATMRVSASDAKIKQCDCKQFDIFITPTSETREDIAHSAVALEDLPNTCYSYHLMRCRLKQTNKITASYLRYYFDIPRARQDFWKIAKGQTRYVISKYDVGKIVVPFPPLSRQKEIVEILDKFDTLVNDISKGLPREIELRSKQYEYYRERLVNFG